MSQALFNKLGGLRFWDAEQIMRRNQAIDRIALHVTQALKAVNPAWRFFRCETPILTPSNYISDEYVYGNDVFCTNHDAGGHGIYLRPETTAGSYAYIDWLLTQPKIKLPICVWQAGKSFRRETDDGASARKLRFNEFWQLEFQCCYAEGTKADYQYSEMLLL